MSLAKGLRILIAALVVLAFTCPPAHAASTQRAQRTRNAAGSSATAFLTIMSVNGTVVAVHRQLVASAAGPQGTTISCNHLASWTDYDGTFTLQHACGGSTAPWGYTLSRAVCSGATTPVYEAGMMWALNGTTQGTQSFHSEPCGYQLHGSFNPALDNSHVAYSDVMTWNAGAAHLQVQIYGSFVLASNAGGICGGISFYRGQATFVPAC